MCSKYINTSIYLQCTIDEMNHKIFKVIWMKTKLKKEWKLNQKEIF